MASIGCWSSWPSIDSESTRSRRCRWSSGDACSAAMSQALVGDVADVVRIEALRAAALVVVGPVVALAPSLIPAPFGEEAVELLVRDEVGQSGEALRRAEHLRGM